MQSNNSNLVTSPTEDGAYSEMNTSVNDVNLFVKQLNKGSQEYYASQSPPMQSRKDNTLQTRSKIGNTQPVPVEVSAQNYEHRNKKTDLLTDGLRSIFRTPPDRDFLRKRTKEKKTKYESIIAGSELGYGRPGYKHHAVVTELKTNQYEIFHITGSSKDSLSSSSGRAKASPVTENKNFDDGYPFLYDYGVAAFDGDVVVLRARILYDAYNSIDTDYNLCKFNCHHLSSYVVTGQTYSRKLESCGCIPGTSSTDIVRKKLNSGLYEGLKDMFKKEGVDTDAFEKIQEDFWKSLLPTTTNQKIADIELLLHTTFTEDLAVKLVKDLQSAANSWTIPNCPAVNYRSSKVTNIM